VSTKPVFIDLFAGIGGIRTGFERAGMECVYTSEKDAHAQKVYELNYGELPDGDITSVDEKLIPDHNVILAGFPCQPFSSAGHKMGFEDTRGTLFFDILRIAKEKQPEVLLLENVKNLAHHDGGKTLKVIIASLEDLGYNVDYRILNSKDFGVPQSRERMIIVASRNKAFDFDKVATREAVYLKDFLDKEEAANDGAGFEYLDPNDYMLLDPSIIKRQASGLIFAGYRKGNLRTAGIRPGSENLSRAHKQQNRIYSAEGIHPTISSQESSGRFFILHEGRVRKLTMQECYRIFGFPDGFKLTGSMAERYRRIGNSVCVPMMEALAQQVKAQELI
jgi:DNA (cytosine-5)-methyltransferase 1